VVGTVSTAHVGEWWRTGRYRRRERVARHSRYRPR